MERPFVYMNMATTVDGKITSAGREYAEFTSDLDRRTMDRLRAGADAVLIGAGTLRSDDPPLQVRDPDMRQRRRDQGRPARLLPIVLSNSGELNPAARFFRCDDRPAPMVVTTDRIAPERKAGLQEVAEVVILGSTRVDLHRLMGLLVARGIRRLLVEGGGETNWTFLEQGLVDEIYVTIAPALLGGRDAPTLVGGAGWPIREIRPLRLLEVAQEGDELFCRYEVLSP